MLIASFKLLEHKHDKMKRSCPSLFYHSSRSSAMRHTQLRMKEANLIAIYFIFTLWTHLHMIVDMNVMSQTFICYMVHDVTKLEI